MWRSLQITITEQIRKELENDQHMDHSIILKRESEEIGVQVGQDHKRLVGYGISTSGVVRRYQLILVVGRCKQCNS